MGIGLNVRHGPDPMPPELADQAIALADSGHPLDRLHVLDELLHQIDHAWHEMDEASLAEAWRRRDALLQTRATFRLGERELTGRVIDIDPAQGLLLEVERGPVVALPAATASLVLDPP